MAAVQAALIGDSSMGSTFLTIAILLPVHILPTEFLIFKYYLIIILQSRPLVKPRDSKLRKLRWCQDTSCS